MGKVQNSFNIKECNMKIVQHEKMKKVHNLNKDYMKKV